MKDHNKEEENKIDDTEEGYLGNIWGWKFSYISLAFLLIVMLIAALSYDPSKTYDAEPETIDVIPDTLHDTPIEWSED